MGRGSDGDLRFNQAVEHGQSTVVRRSRAKEARWCARLKDGGRHAGTRQILFVACAVVAR